MFAAGIVVGSTHKEAAEALFQYNASPAARAVMKTKGFEMPWCRSGSGWKMKAA